MNATPMRWMRRTRLRPLPDGRVAASDARIFGIAMSALGLVLARRAREPARGSCSRWSTLVVYSDRLHADEAAHVARDAGRRGAWRAAAARSDGRHRTAAVSVGGAALFAIVFLWQIPHFMAIAWLYRDDYGKAGFPMLLRHRARGATFRPPGAALRDRADPGHAGSGARRRQRHGLRRCRARARTRIAVAGGAVRRSRAPTGPARRCSSARSSTCPFCGSR